MAPYTEEVWSFYGVEFSPRCGALVFLKRALYGLNNKSNPFHKYFRDFLRDLGFAPSRAYQELCIRKYDDYDIYDYIETHVKYVIIPAKNTPKYRHEIEMHFKVGEITDSKNYYLGNELL